MSHLNLLDGTYDSDLHCRPSVSKWLSDLANERAARDGAVF